MQRYTALIAEGMISRHHQVEIWSPKAYFYRIPIYLPIRKWLGYIDQFIIFPFVIKKRITKCNPDTLFVFTDHALGLYVPMVTNRKHIIHCHDFLAQKSAMDQIPEQGTALTGKLYQYFIRKGFNKGRNFISVSESTQNDLHRLLPSAPNLSTVVYNGLNKIFHPIHKYTARKLLSEKTGIKYSQGFILHVGGNDWYKNRSGVIEIYNKWRSIQEKKLPLLLLGAKPNSSLIDKVKSSPYSSSINFLVDPDDIFLNIAYSGASLLLYPSLNEGFGWPIAEALAAGCPVITTNEAPMTEVGGEAAFYISRRPIECSKSDLWTDECAAMINQVMNLSVENQEKLRQLGIENIMRFDLTNTLDEIESNYYRIKI